MNLEGKNIIVTGGSLGIGKETATILLEKGANVLVTGRSLERLENAFMLSKANFKKPSGVFVHGFLTLDG